MELPQCGYGNEYHYVSKHDTHTNGNILLECKEFINVQYD